MRRTGLLECALRLHQSLSTVKRYARAAVFGGGLPLGHERCRIAAAVRAAGQDLADPPEVFGGQFDVGGGCVLGHALRSAGAGDGDDGGERRSAGT